MFQFAILFHRKWIHLWNLAFINYWVTYWFLLFFSFSVTILVAIILWLCFLWRPLRRLAFSVTRKVPKSLLATHVVESIRYHLLSAQLCMPFSTFFTYMRTVLSKLTAHITSVIFMESGFSNKSSYLHKMTTKPKVRHLIFSLWSKLISLFGETLGAMVWRARRYVQ